MLLRCDFLASSRKMDSACFYFTRALEVSLAYEWVEKKEERAKNKTKKKGGDGWRRFRRGGD